MDRGPGVAPEHQQRVFEPFYRLPGVSETGGGVGLGLALVKSIAERHGGSVRCRNNPQGGARFELTLPVGNAQAL
jgi:signal transduction histidine kinase